MSKDFVRIANDVMTGVGMFETGFAGHNEGFRGAVDLCDRVGHH